MTLGPFMEARRNALGITLTELAERTGLSHAYISMLEHGRRRKPSPSKLRTLATALQVPVSELEARVQTDSGAMETLQVVAQKSRDALSELPGLIASIKNLVASLDPVTGPGAEQGTEVTHEDGSRSGPGADTYIPSGVTVARRPGVEDQVAFLEWGGGGATNRSSGPDSTRALAANLNRLIKELSRMNSALPQRLDQMEARLPYPRYSEKVEALARRIARLGDEEVGFLIQMVDGVERLTKVTGHPGE